MSDFETSPIGTQKEVLLARVLVKAIEQLIEQYGDGIIPHSILNPYLDLKDHYEDTRDLF